MLMIAAKLTQCFTLTRMRHRSGEIKFMQLIYHTSDKTLMIKVEEIKIYLHIIRTRL